VRSGAEGSKRQHQDADRREKHEDRYGKGRCQRHHGAERIGQLQFAPVALFESHVAAVIGHFAAPLSHVWTNKALTD
jgi:hypothetical protein